MQGSAQFRKYMEKTSAATDYRSILKYPSVFKVSPVTNLCLNFESTTKLPKLPDKGDHIP